MRRVEVPLWVAIILKKQSRCNIIAPTWLSEDSLKAAYEAEASNMTRFSNKLPWEWIEVGELVLTSAPDDLACPPHIIRNLLRDIREIRQAKVRAGLKSLDPTYMQIDNVGAMELNEIRQFVTMTMNELRVLQNGRAEEEAEEEVEQYPGEDSDLEDTLETTEYSIPRDSSNFDDSLRSRSRSAAPLGERRPTSRAPAYEDDEGDEEEDLEMDESYLHTVKDNSSGQR